jgi:hypothetical protein
MKIAIGLLGGLDGDLLLKELRPVTQRDGLSVKPIEALAQLLGRSPKRKFLAEVEPKPLNERAQDHKLPMQARGRPSNAHEHLPALTHILGEDLLLDAVELAGSRASTEPCTRYW